MLTEELLFNADLLGQLALAVEIPEAIAAWEESGEVDCHLQLDTDLTLVSEARVRRLAEKLAALANGALLRNVTTGYLVFDYARSSLKSRTTTGQELITRCFGDIDEEELIDSLNQSINRWLEPSIHLRLGRLQGSVLGFISATSAHAVPVFAAAIDEEGNRRWILPVWNADDGWLVKQALDQQYAVLFKRALEGVFAENGASGELASVRWTWDTFGKNPPITRDEFVSFLVGLLIKTDPEVRAAAAGALSRVGGLGEETRPLICQLLSALLQDEPQVAEVAIGSLQQFHSEQYLDAVLHAINLHIGDRRLIEIGLGFVGALGSRESTDRLKEMYGILPPENHDHVDRAIAQLYRRFRITPYEHDRRTEFVTLITAFKYAQAAKMMSEKGTEVCQLRWHRNALSSLARFGAARFNLAFDDAVAALEELALPEDDDMFRPLFERFKSEMHRKEVFTSSVGQESDPSQFLAAKRRQDEFSLAERLYCAETSLWNLDYADHVSRLFNIVDDEAKHVAECVGVAFANDRKSVDRRWLSERPQLRQALRDEDNSLRLRLCRILEMLDESPAIAEAVQLIRRFDKLIVEVRHQGPYGHGGQAVTRAACEDAYQGNVQKIGQDVRQLHALCTGVQLGENPYWALNRDIRWILDSSEARVPTWQDFVQHELTTVG